MNVNRALQFTDELIFQHTGKHLDDVQKVVVEGTWQKETYEDMAQSSNLTEKHLSDVGYELWELLSKVLNEDIKKSNFSIRISRNR